MATASATPSKRNQIMATLALSTTEGSYTFTASDTARLVTVQLLSDAAWLVADVTSGPYFRVPADTPFEVELRGKTTVVYAKTVSGTGTLYAMVAK